MLSVTLPLLLSLCMSEKSPALSLGCRSLQTPPQPPLLRGKHYHEAGTQAESRQVFMLATRLLTPPSLQFAGVPVMVGDGRLSLLLTIPPRSSPCRAGTHPPVPMDRHLVPGARCCAPCCCCPASCHEAFVLQLLQLVCYLPKTTVFNKIYHPPQIYLFTVSLQGSQFVKYCKFTTKLKENTYLKSWLLGSNWHILSIYT